MGMVERVMQTDKPSNWNLPNVLTSLRILFIPVFAWLVLSERWWWAFGLFVALMITALVTLNIAGPLPVWVTVVIVARELGITVWRMWMLRRGLVVPASKGGKVKTVLQSLAVGLYLCPLPAWADTPVFVVMLLAVAVTVVTGVQYLVDAGKANK